MKKFSKLSTKDESNKKTDPIQDNINNIIENNLKISVNGELDQYLQANIDIEGKEKLVEEMRNYINKLSIENSKVLLEKVRYQGIDTVESEFEAILEKQTPSERKKHIERVLSLLDKDDVKEQTERQAKAIKSGEKAYYRAIAAENLIGDERTQGKKKDLQQIHDIFLFRSKQLGYKK